LFIEFTLSVQGLSVSLQSHMIKVLKSLLYSERNQQTMCTDGFVKDLFTFCNAALVDESHLFHQSIQYMFESMAAQSLKPNDLRYTVSPILLPHPSAASSTIQNILD